MGAFQFPINLRAFLFSCVSFFSLWSRFLVSNSLIRIEMCGSKCHCVWSVDMAKREHGCHYKFWLISGIKFNFYEHYALVSSFIRTLSKMFRFCRVFCFCFLPRGHYFIFCPIIVVICIVDTNFFVGFHSNWWRKVGRLKLTLLSKCIYHLLVFLSIVVQLQLLALCCWLTAFWLFWLDCLSDNWIIASIAVRFLSVRGPTEALHC